MAQAVTPHVSTKNSRSTDRLLWLGLLAGPVVYSLYFVAGYLFAEATCTADLLRFRVLGLEAVSFWIVMVTLAAAAITGISTAISLRYWRRTRLESESDRAERSYPPFMAFVGAWLGGFFTLLILLTGVPALFLVICDWV